MNTQVLPVNDKSIALAAELLQKGELVALPTETVYGIAADARNGEAVKKIFEAKGRPQDNPLIVHIYGMEMLKGIVSEVPDRAYKLAKAFWPGPLTMVMPRGGEVSDVTCAGLDTVGVRMPSHPVVQAVIKASGVAFAAPSANLSGKPSPTNAQDTLVDMDGRLPLILDGGESAVGVESTPGRRGRCVGHDAAAPRLHNERADGRGPGRRSPRQPRDSGKAQGWGSGPLSRHEVQALRPQGAGHDFARRFRQV